MLARSRRMVFAGNMPTPTNEWEKRVEDSSGQLIQDTAEM